MKSVVKYLLFAAGAFLAYRWLRQKRGALSGLGDEVSLWQKLTQPAGTPEPTPYERWKAQQAAPVPMIRELPKGFDPLKGQPPPGQPPPDKKPPPQKAPVGIVYDPFGRLQAPEGALEARLRFLQQQRMSPTGLYVPGLTPEPVTTAGPVPGYGRPLYFPIPGTPNPQVAALLAYIKKRQAEIKAKRAMSWGLPNKFEVLNALAAEENMLRTYMMQVSQATASGAL